MDIQKIIQAVSAAKIKQTQAKAKSHFESTAGYGPQMNMIAFD